MTTRTAIDAAKEAATIRLTYAYGGSYDIASKVELSGRGIKSFGNGNYHVTDAALEGLKKKFSWAPDF